MSSAARQLEWIDAVAEALVALRRVMADDTADAKTQFAAAETILRLEMTRMRTGRPVIGTEEPDADDLPPLPEPGRRVAGLIPGLPVPPDVDADDLKWMLEADREIMAERATGPSLPVGRLDDHRLEQFDVLGGRRDERVPVRVPHRVVGIPHPSATPTRSPAATSPSPLRPRPLPPELRRR